jgi:hypothetical protein
VRQAEGFLASLIGLMDLDLADLESVGVRLGVVAPE